MCHIPGNDDTISMTSQKKLWQPEDTGTGKCRKRKITKICNKELYVQWN